MNRSLSHRWLAFVLCLVITGQSALALASLDPCAGMVEAGKSEAGMSGTAMSADAHHGMTMQGADHSCCDGAGLDESVGPQRCSVNCPSGALCQSASIPLPIRPHVALPRPDGRLHPADGKLVSALIPAPPADVWHPPRFL